MCDFTIFQFFEISQQIGAAGMSCAKGRFKNIHRIVATAEAVLSRSDVEKLFGKTGFNFLFEVVDFFRQQFFGRFIAVQHMIFFLRQSL